jgi:DNA-binding GntR family transcriptional regulator
MNIEISEPVNGAAALSDLAYERLRDRLVRVEIAPGSPLQEDQLSEEFRVGLTPIRNAIRRLSFEHLVTIYPRRGTFAADINIGDERWLTEMRLEIEGLSARLAAERASETERRELLRIARAIKATRSNSEVTDLDAIFHRQIFIAARNPFLQTTANLYFNLSLRIWYFCNQSFTVSETRGADHMALAEAIAAQNPDRAYAASREHLLLASQAIRSLLASGSPKP